MGELKDLWAKLRKDSGATDAEKEDAKKRINEIEKDAGYKVTDFSDNKPSSSKGVYSGKSYTKKSVKKTIPDAEPFDELLKTYDRLKATAHISTKKTLPEQDENSYEFNVTYGAELHDLVALHCAENN